MLPAASSFREIDAKHLLSKKQNTAPINARSQLGPSQPLKKMIAEKEFRTITLRGLDDKPEIVGIMNDVMKTHGLKTGQSTIEHIIVSFAKLQKELADVNANREKEMNRYYKWRQETEEQIEELKKTIGTAQVALKRIFDTKL